MFRKIAVCAPIALILSALALTGCPTLAPLLNVSPTAFSFDTAQTSAPLTITNAGAGALAWSVQSKPDWLTVTPDSGSITEAQVVMLTANLAALAPGTQQGELILTSNGGTRGLAVTAFVVSPPTMEVSETGLDFGGSLTVLSFDVSNAGSGTLTWNLTSDLPAAFNISPTSGSTTAGASDTVTVILNRAGLDRGLYEGTITITSDGGGPVDVAVRATVQALTVAPTLLDYGPIIEDLSFVIGNSGNTDLNWTIDGAQLAPLTWLVLIPGGLSGVLAPGAERSILASIDRNDLPAGVTEAQFDVSSPDGTETVRLRVEGPEPVLFVTPVTLDFGSTDNDQTVTLQNTGTGTLAWTIEEVAPSGGGYIPGDVTWLSVDGALTGDLLSNEAVIKTVRVDRLQVVPNPDEPFVGHLRVSSADGQQVVVTVSQLSIPPTLRILPADLDFATTYLTRKLAIWNGGLGTVNWTIDAPPAGIPGWVDSFTPTSGSVSGDETDMVTVRIDRTGFDPADQDYTWVFDIDATDGGGAALDSVTVTTSMNVARVPRIAVETGHNDTSAPFTPFLPMGQDLQTNTFTITNVGTGNLTWSIEDAEAFPSWLAVDPLTLTLEPGESIANITVTVDREGLGFGSEEYTFDITSNDPIDGSVPLRVELQVPKKVVIAVRPGEIALGPYGISDTFEVANNGDPGSQLKFSVTSNKPWLFSNPEFPYQFGTSEGTSSPIKDWQPVDISINRADLEGTGSTGTLTVRAYDEDGELIESVEEMQVTVSVEAAELSFQLAHGRTRIPTLNRFVMLMRDITYRAIPLAQDIVGDFVDNFTIYEKDVPLELSETNQFLLSADRMRTNLVLLLDYSGSMFASAALVEDPAIAGAADPLQELYNRCIGQLITELPDSYYICLMEFHDRSQPTRVVAPDGGPLFTNDKALLLSRLEGISIADHGATELMPAIEEAALRLQSEDLDLFLIPFDDSDMRAIICVTDGRLTTPPGRARETVDYLFNRFVRFFPIGWGQAVMHESLARVAAGTGGHYYPTITEDSGMTDPQGNPIKRPLVSQLLAWCETEDPATNPCDQSIAKDLRSQVILSYGSLREDSPITVRVDGAFDNPNDDDGVCLPEQNIITGTFSQKDFNFTSVMGDGRLGQISLPTTAINGSTARAIVRAEYMPRNVDQFVFEISSPQTFTVSKAPPLQAGLVEDWTLTPLGGGQYSLTRPAGVDPLPYAAFGDMLYVDFDALPLGLDSFVVNFSVIDPVYDAGDPEGKYFTHPDSVTVNDLGQTAPAFPTPRVTVTQPASDSYLIALGSTGNSGQIDIRNVGGAHVPTGAWLRWFITDWPDILLPSAFEGDLVSTFETDTVSFDVNRSSGPGSYLGAITIIFDSYLLGTPSFSLEILVSVTILPPELTVTSANFDPGTTTLNFGDANNAFDLSIQNTGQSTLDWNIDTTAFPNWLSVSTNVGFVPLDAANTVTVYVFRDDQDPGNYTHDFTIASEYGSETITVNMTVP
ncbi:MAG: hypothetical protein GWP08_07750 [Nitrospiraceae bacterium]|nr:hypothetical protein [Nitrospiraceae bacterium]